MKTPTEIISNLDKELEFIDLRFDKFMEPEFRYLYNLVNLACELYGKYYCKNKKFISNTFHKVFTYLSDPKTMELSSKVYSAYKKSKKALSPKLREYYLFFAYQYFFIKDFALNLINNSIVFYEDGLYEKMDYNKYRNDVMKLVLGLSDKDTFQGYTSENHYVNKTLTFLATLKYLETSNPRNLNPTTFNDKNSSDLKFKKFNSNLSKLCGEIVNKDYKEKNGVYGCNHKIKEVLKNNVLSQEELIVEEEISEEGFLAGLVVSIISIPISISLIRFIILCLKKFYVDIGKFFKANSEYIDVNIEYLENEIENTHNQKEKKRLEKSLAKQKKWNEAFKRYYQKILGVTKTEYPKELKEAEEMGDPTLDEPVETENETIIF